MYAFTPRQFQVVRSVQHAAVRVAARTCERGDILFRRRKEHDRAAHLFGKLLGEHRLRYFGAEISEVDRERVAARLLNVCQCLLHMDLALHDAHGAFVDILFAVPLLVGGDERFSSVHRQTFGKAVARDCNNSYFDLGMFNILSFYLTFEE